MDTLVEISSTLSSIISTFWTTSVATFGVVPTLILCCLITVGIYTVSKTSVNWIINKFRSWFCKKEEVILLPQTYVSN